MRIFLTGATGFIGTRLAGRLAAHQGGLGHEVRALVRQEASGSQLDARVKRVRGRLDDPEFLRAMLEGTDAVIHLAGVTKAFTAQGFFRVNEGLAATLAESFDRHAPEHAVLLSVSSQAAGGPCATLPGLRESDQPAPVSQYGMSKLLGERAVLALSPRRRVGVARPPIVYGPGDLAPLPLYRGMASGLLLASGDPGQRFSIVHVDDLVDGLVLLLDALAQGRAGGVFHFAGPQSFDWEEYAAAFGAALGRERVRVLRAPRPLVLAAAWAGALLGCLGLPSSHLTPDKAREAAAPGWLLDWSKAARELGYAPKIALAAGAVDAIAWCRDQGLLPAGK